LEKIIMYNVVEADKLSDIAFRHHIQSVRVGKASLGKTIAELETAKDEGVSGDGSDSLIVFCGLSDRSLDCMLDEIKTQGIKVDFKATQTKSNKGWTLETMIKEMKRERFEYMRRGLF